jgi:hypothetical protein
MEQFEKLPGLRINEDGSYSVNGGSLRVSLHTSQGFRNAMDERWIARLKGLRGVHENPDGNFDVEIVAGERLVHIELKRNVTRRRTAGRIHGRKRASS